MTVDLDQFLQNQGAPEVPSAPAAPQVDLDQFVKAEEDKQKYDRPIEAFAQGAARTATFGLSDAAQVASGFRTGEELAKIKEISPKATFAGDVTGIIGPALLPEVGVLGAVGKGTGLLTGGVTAVGKTVEQAIAKKLLGEAAAATTKSAATEILKRAAAKGLATGVEGAFYGAGQVVSEAALGDPHEAAEKALTTVGLSALLAGGLGLTGTLAVPILKAAAEKASPAAKQFFSTITGLNKETVNVLRKRPEAIDEFLQSGDDIATAFQNKATQTGSYLSENAQNLLKKQGRLVEERLNAPDMALKSAPIKIVDKEASKVKQDFFDVFKEARDKLNPEGLSPLPEDVSKLATIDQIEGNLISAAKKNAGIPPEAVVAPEDLDKLFLTPKQLNALKAQFQEGAKFDSTKPAFIQTMYRKLQYVANDILEKEVSPEIRQFNKPMSRLFGLEDDLSKHGFDIYSPNPDKLKNLYSANSKILASAEPKIKELDQLLGTKWWDEIQAGQAYRNLYDQGGLSRSFTGRSLLIPTVSGAAGAVIGGPLGAAVGGLAGQALQMPAVSRALVKGTLRVQDALKALATPMAKLGANTNYLAKPELLPFIAARISAMNTFKEQHDRVDSKIRNSIKGYLNNENPEKPGTPGSLNSLPDFKLQRGGPGETRQNQFDKNMRDFQQKMADPVALADQITNNLRQINLVAPQMADAMTEKAINMAQYLYQKAPKSSQFLDPLTQKEGPSSISDTQLAQWERYLQAANDPMHVLEDMKYRRVSPEAAEVLQQHFPILFSKMQNTLLEAAKDAKRPMTYQDRVFLSQLFKVPLHDSMQGAKVQAYQQNFQQPEAAPAPQGGKPLGIAEGQLTNVQKVEGR